MKSNYDLLGNHIRLIDNRNKDLVTEQVLGINIDKFFMPSVANVIGTDLSKYKLIQKGNFACNPMHVGRDERLPVALYSEDTPAIVSPAYFMFEIKDTTVLNADFLMMWFRRPEFDRICWLHTDGSVRGGITWDDICRMEIPVPPIDEQIEIVSSYQAITERIKLKKQINDNLEQQAQSIFDNMFPNISNGSCTIGDYITPKRGKSLLSKNAIFGDVPVIAGGLEPSTYHNVANTRSPVLAISASGANAGYVSLWNIPIWSSDSSYIDSSMTDDVYFWYVLLKKRQKEIFDAQTGSAQPHIYPQHIASMSVSNLDIEEVHSYTSIVIPIFEIIGHHKEENTRLASLRDTLLPKLMSGELDVSNIEL